MSCPDAEIKTEVAQDPTAKELVAVARTQEVGSRAQTLQGGPVGPVGTASSEFKSCSGPAGNGATSGKPCPR